MIASNFAYYKASDSKEASVLYEQAQKHGSRTVFFSGGTEIITFARTDKFHPDAVIDIKGIAECNLLEMRGGKLIIGAAVTLNTIADSALFPLLCQTVKGIANRTARNKITIGGNINSALIYKESVLPLLLAGAEVCTVKDGCQKTLPLSDVFDKQLNLAEGEWLHHLAVDAQYLELPGAVIKRTSLSKVGYPVVTAAALMKDQKLRIAFSGLCEFPFRSEEIEEIVNDQTLSIEQRVEKAAAKLPAEIVDDMHAAKEYRAFVLRNAVTDIIKELEEAK